MNVVVDSSVWSLALRRNTTNDAIAIVKVLRDLIEDGRVVLLGAIRQEVLSGVRYLAIEKLAIERVSSPHIMAYQIQYSLKNYCKWVEFAG